jgi:hypothetical protein
LLLPHFVQQHILHYKQVLVLAQVQVVRPVQQELMVLPDLMQ